ncbi:hypothetical protein [Arenimonas sp. GDDSR-1]|uniref:hypothetical protein n=1 Tax=Arenimonas sp. GDDSR-1 TaxID=2950125 RepID=UPI0026135D9F|nr:hypothetical protein [Arenimonas sp. GDDSR-1]
MTVPVRPLRWLTQARWREVGVVLAIGLPPLAAACYLLGKSVGAIAAWVFLGAALALFGLILRHRLQRLDNAWLIRRLDALPVLENSADLLFGHQTSESPLVGLQRQRIQQRLAALPEQDLRRPFPMAWISGMLLLSLAMISAALFWPKPQEAGRFKTQATVESVARTPVKLIEAHLRIIPPAYTGLPARNETGLPAKFPEGSRIVWQLRFAPQPGQVRLQFFSGRNVDLHREGDAWTADAVMTASDVYRAVIDGQAQNKPWQRLDAIPDQAPQWRVSLPDRSLSLLAPGQRTWPLQLEAEDDYGLSDAVMEIQLAQGSGENIQFKSSSRALIGQGTSKRQRYAATLDLAALGMQAGDDLIVQFRVGDRRRPQANSTVSAAYILRWPVEDAYEASGVEGMLKKVMPAYFRSQRQIIIDTEKLLAEKKKLSREQFEIRSDTIGVDQRVLRLRYGQFLGEESETPEPPSEDGGHHADDGHDHGGGKAPEKSATVSDQSILEQFGHTHDIPEAATLLDAGTKSLLRSALNEMWQAELHLRQAEPAKALPFEYRALAFIKKVQQAERIYLARVGPELPPIDESRRLSGDRSGFKAPDDELRAAVREDAPLLAFWQSLDAADPPKTADLKTWMADHGDRLPDALGLKVALAEMESRPDCRSCREAVKALLWPVLAKPPAVPKARRLQPVESPYQRALQKERQP